MVQQDAEKPVRPVAASDTVIRSDSLVQANACHEKLQYWRTRTVTPLSAALSADLTVIGDVTREKRVQCGLGAIKKSLTARITIRDDVVHIKRAHGTLGRVSAAVTIVQVVLCLVCSSASYFAPHNRPQSAQSLSFVPPTRASPSFCSHFATAAASRLHVDLTMDSRNAPYTLVDTTAGAHSALQVLATSPFLLLDCEGQQLGCFDGELSLLNVGTAGGDIFVFDAVLLPCEMLHRVVAFVADARRLKYVWDGRKDYSELYHGHHHRLANVVDLQLVDILSRPIREYGRHGEAAFLQVEATHPGIHRLTSLKRVLQAHDLSDRAEGMQTCRPIHAFHRHDEWLQRPLPEELISYAVKDVVLLGYVREEFQRKGYLDNQVLLQQQSMRYISLHDRARPDPDDVFAGSHLLPLEIFHFPTGMRVECGGCHRMLAKRSFEAADWKARAKGVMCRVCCWLVQTGRVRVRAPVPTATQSPESSASEVYGDRATSPSLLSDASSVSSRSASPMTPATPPPAGSPIPVRIPVPHRSGRHSCPPKSFYNSPMHSQESLLFHPDDNHTRGVSVPALYQSPGASFSASSLLGGNGAAEAGHDGSWRSSGQRSREAAAWRAYICSTLVKA
ncbi:ribonuclease H-like domain-containing protein [Auriculariales sp. MPI-PUGE-AT-0066]|nr:ribonuclease H-like domain-containing protein [Auriculariales sp. MPI-PUGE-AT-0066]